MSRPSAPLEALLPGALSLDLLARGSEDEVDRRICAAALAVLSEHGTESASMAEIATRAGVGRATVFRRFGSKDELFRHAVAAEVRRFLTGIACAFAEITDPAERICVAFAACLGLGETPLVRGATPERRAALVAALAHGEPAPIDMARGFVAERLREGQADGSVRPGDPELLADALIRIVLGYFIVPSPSVDPTDSESLRRAALAVVAPMALTGLRPPE